MNSSMDMSCDEVYYHGMRIAGSTSADYCAEIIDSLNSCMQTEKFITAGIGTRRVHTTAGNLRMASKKVIANPDTLIRIADALGCCVEIV